MEENIERMKKAVISLDLVNWLIENPDFSLDDFYVDREILLSIARFSNLGAKHTKESFCSCLNFVRDELLLSKKFGDFISKND
jgi:hypothetical protein